MQPKLSYQERAALEELRTEAAHETIRDVADLLGWTYTRKETQSGMLANGKHGIHCYYDAWHNRISFSGRYPGNLSRHIVDSGHAPDNDPKITVAPTKAPDKIARDIQRRLLPLYGKVYADLEKRDQQWEAAQNRLADIATAIAKNGRGSIVDQPHMNRHEKYRDHRATFGAKGAGMAPWGRAEISSYQGDHVNMELRNLPPELAIYIASLLGEWAEDEKGSNR